MEPALPSLLSSPTVLAAWGLVVAAALAVLAWDLTRHNAAVASLMKFVWALTTLYAGPFGLAVYWVAGRRQISHDSLWRRGLRSVAHCFSGCGAGEIVGVVVAVGVLSLPSSWVVAVTFACAYTFGYALTVGPLLQEGVGVRQALVDALYSETPSITVMELVAIGSDVVLAGDAGIGEVLFWSSLVVSLSLGFLAAYPVNVYLVARGVKEGMQNPAALSA